MADVERDEISGTDTTGHEWDGIKELNTPLPRWWILTFYATIVWALGYVILYPALPLIDSATGGLLGYSSRAELAAELTQAKAAQAQYLDRIASASPAEIRADQDLLQFAIAGGRSAFSINCAPCHGAGAQGAAGYPNLNDDDWLWGGSLDEIYATLKNGIRAPHNDDTRDSIMPAFGTDEVLEKAQIADVTNFVLALSGKDHDSAAAQRGAEVFADNCAACHGEKGTGNKEFGAPSLADAIWLYGQDAAAIGAQISSPKHGVMPAWAGRLDDTVIKQLTVYVHSLGGGQ
ncbi:MAG TPA: cytochrome-c oxidase, cbb3-type subunit III [Hyphomicrobiales bacterium]|nr:cytochrome-c oxidase, cbb3-type subunit III [Rhodobiaceae bacterium]HXK53727.1 cytochrome-c oxidase, cbb3-type subunit III [Hyphomicrobiales bacterium]